MKSIRLMTGAAAMAFAATSSVTATAAVVRPDGASVAELATASATVAARKKAAAERRQQRRLKRAAAAPRNAAADTETATTTADQGDIVVTGTRIASNYGKTGSPVQTIERGELDRRGLAQLDDALNSLPAVQPNYGNQTRNTNNDPSAFGRSPVNLRNLGANRTLVLVNGQRAKNDTNNIPAAMIERVEVLTGGASAVYGSDAVGGVINYILKRNFTGITIDGEGSFFQHTNDNREMRQYLADARYKLPPGNFIGGPQGYVNAAGGINLFQGRANLSGNIGYRVVSDLASNKYDTTACSLADGTPDAALPGAFNDHSHRYCTSMQEAYPYGLFATRGDPATKVESQYYSNAYNGSKHFRIFNEADTALLQPDDYIYRSNKRWDWGLNGQFRVDEASSTDIVASFSDARYSTRSTTKYMSSLYVPDVLINCDNPYLSQQQATLFCGTRAGDPGAFGDLALVWYWPSNARQKYDYQFTETRATVQARGKLTNDIRYEANFIRFDHRDHSNFTSFLSERRLKDGLRARSVNGRVVCLPPQTPPYSADPAQFQLDTQDDANCQPLDVFSSAGPGKAGFDYLTNNPGADDQRTLELVVNGTVSGNLGAYGVHSPFAKDPVGFSVNVESRRQEFSKNATGALYAPFVSTLFRETDLSGELSLPLVQDKPLLKYLQVSGAYRRMFFPRQPGGSTYRLGLDYRIDSSVTLRGSYSTSYRVDPYSTYSPTKLDISPDPRLLDLCSPPGGKKPVVTRLTAQQCERFGVTAQQYAALTNRRDCDERGKCPGNILSGGNIDLRPERGTSVTAGLTITPKVLPHFTFGVDYYRITILGFISDVDPNIAFIQCQSGTNFYCARYKRDPVSGRIDVPGTYADGRPANFGSQRNEGIDFNASYRFDTLEVLKKDVGAIDINFIGNLRTKNEQQKLAGQQVFDCTGYYGYGGKENCGSAPNAGWRHTVRLVWAVPWSGLALNGLWRYSASVRYAGLSSNPILSTAPTASDGIISRQSAHLPASSLFDLGATMKVGKAASLRLTINNVFDKDPYLMVNANGGWYNTQPLMYDVFGRKVTIGFSASF